MKNIIIVLIAIVAFTSCDDFLEEYPSKQSNQPIKTTEDLDLLLNNVIDYSFEYNYAAMCATDNAAVDTFHYKFQPKIFTNSNSLGWFLWDEYVLKNANEHTDWVKEFGKIGKANLVLDFLNEVEGPEAEKEELRYEAHFVRAYSYFNLVTVYCLPYSEENAGEAGLPLRTTISVEQSLERATLQETYDFIEADIKMALKTGAKEWRDLPWRYSLPAVEAFAARFYLYIGKYDMALTHASNALDAHSQLVSFEEVMYQNGELYNWLGLGSLYPYSKIMTSADMFRWPELYYNRFLGQRTYYQHAYPSEKLINIYDTTDIRYDALFVENVRVGTSLSPYVGYAYLGSGNYIPSGPTTGEMYLIRAECYARQGNAAQTSANVEALRQARYKAADYEPLEYPAGEKELTQLVIDERNREFPFTLRWYDLHRINRDPLLDNVTISRTFYSLNGNLPELDAPLKTYTLDAGSRRYAFPLTENEIISSGEELEQNTY
ncbi:RagB/SusD family nutrient uptake outer membrane protein [Mariniphaga sediminis]|uniref:RagB/SusD family nutrient uptake outer membrane protein n=1 Tax=Mariniphaga sediminis TaxID=1628158 RepID=UPI003568C493